MICEPRTWLGKVFEFGRAEDAVSATEYAILLAVLILGSVGVIGSIGSSFRGIYVAIAAKIPDA